MLNEVVKGKTSEELLSDLEEFLPGGIVYRSTQDRSVRTIFSHGKGSRLWDVDGNEYIDYILGSAPMILGHAHPEVTKALHDRVDNGTQFMQPTDIMLKHAKKVVGAIEGAEKIKYTGTGSEAVFIALMLARGYTGKSKILKFEGAFHGTCDYVSFSTIPSLNLDFPNPEPDTQGIPKGVQDSVLIAPYNDPVYAEKIIRENKDDLAAVLLCPQTLHIPAEQEFIDTVRKVTKENGVLFILDEVVTGFRVAWGGAQSHYGVKPDLTILGKALGGGIGIGCLVGPNEIMQYLDPAKKSTGEYVQGSGTFTGNPLATTAGLAALNVLEQPGTYEKLYKMADRLSDNLQKICESLEVPAVILKQGPTVDLKFSDTPIKDYRSSLNKDNELHDNMAVELMKRGVFSHGTSFYISTVHTKEEIDETSNIFEQSLRKIRGLI